MGAWDPLTITSCTTNLTFTHHPHKLIKPTIKTRLWFWFCFRVEDLIGPPNSYDTDTNPLLCFWQSMYTLPLDPVELRRYMFFWRREEKKNGFHWNGPYKLQSRSAESTKSSRYHSHALFIHFFLSVFPFSLINHISSSISHTFFFTQITSLPLSHFITIHSQKSLLAHHILTYALFLSNMFGKR